jgi:hypothetical protein
MDSFLEPPKSNSPALLSETNFKVLFTEHISKLWGFVFNHTFPRCLMFPPPDSLPPSASFLLSSKNVDTAFSLRTTKKRGYF